MEFDFWQTVAESAIRGVVAALLVALLAFIRLSVKARVEYRAFNALSRLSLRDAAEHTNGPLLIWYRPTLRFDTGTNTTWAYEQIAADQMKWWAWFRTVLWCSLLHKRSTAEPKGLSRRQ